MNRNNNIWMLVCIISLVSCEKDLGNNIDPVRPVEWVENAWTQPVPPWGSPIRLSFPVPLGNVLMGPGGGFGAFGGHQGAHVEGLNHIWIPTPPGQTIKSWGSGRVTKIEDRGDRGNGVHEYFITIDYGHGLIGKHLDIDVPSVSIGQKVVEGQIVGTGTSAEFLLVDMNRTDGERWSGTSSGSPVSPFDYLKEDVKAQVIALHVASVVEPYFNKGLLVGNSRPWEPRLTNPMVFHSAHENTVVGEWLLSNKGWTKPDSLYYDVFTIFDVTNEYGSFKRFEFMDFDWSLTGSKRNGGGVAGTWTDADGPGKIKFELNGKTYFAIYTIEEGGERTKFTLEWKTGSYPSAFTSNAAIYLSRTATYIYDDAKKIGMVK